MKILTPISVQKTLLKENLLCFTPKDFQRIFHIKKQNAKYFLETHTRQNLFIRLKKGLYGLKHNLPGEETIANILYQPSYVSFEYALAKYGILPEMVYQITSATTKATRIYTIGEKIFSYHTLQQKAFTGYIPVKENNTLILIAEPEKALIDYLYFIALGKKTISERLYVKNLDFRKIRRYGAFYKRRSLHNLIQQLSP